MQLINKINIDDLKAVYFDIDGVLSIPNYPLGPHDEFIPFADYDRWVDYFDEGAGSYKYCKIPKSVYGWMTMLKFKNIPIRTLSVSTTFETNAKLQFIQRNYGINNLIDKNILVNSAEDKVKELIKAQEEFNCDRFQIALVEDNHYTLFDTSKEGFRGIHISWFMECLEIEVS